MAMTSFNFRIEEELLEKFTSYCENNNIKRGELLRNLIVRELDSSQIRQVTKEEIEQKLKAAFLDQQEELLQVNFEKQNLITKVGVNTTKNYSYELIENNHTLRVKNNIGAIVKVIHL